MQDKNIKNKVIKFVDLADWECASLIQNNLLEALEIESDTYLEWEVITKLINVSYETRESLSGLLNNALQRNIQKIAGQEIGSWLKKYKEKYPPSKLDPNNFLEFILKNPESQKLNDKDQHILAKIFRMHDYLFINPFRDLQDKFVAIILNTPIRQEKTLTEIQQKTNLSNFENLPRRQITEKLPLRDLLRKYPAVGEQIVSGGQLKLSHFDRPVRPSVRNWIYDYTSQLGQENHDAMQRMKYLFASTNGKNLSSPDREKLGIILKSFDENVPLPVDAANNEIIFEIPETKNDQSPAEESFIKAYPRVGSGPIIQPKPIQNNFVRSHQLLETKPQAPPRPLDQGSTFPPPKADRLGSDESANSSRSNLIQFVNPYPAPETHKTVAAEAEMAGEAPVKLKGFSEGVSKNIQTPAFPALPKVQTTANQSSTFSSPASGKAGDSSKSNFMPPKPYAPSHPKNFIYPHYGTQKGGKPEPRIEGNTVDLRGDQ